VRVTEDFGLTRDATLAALAERGVHAAVYYPKPLTAYAHVRAATDGPLRFPNAEKAAREVLALPVHPALSRSDIDRTIDALRGLSE
jgi:dTDP-4-amino-4,6-dideoxygalactose transaminase